MPEHAPRASAFVRSDQFSFVRQGVPSISVAPGRRPGMDEAEVERRKDWSRSRYHTPRDEWDAAWLWEDTARFARLQFLLALVVADGAGRPAWNRGDFFERFVPGARR